VTEASLQPETLSRSRKASKPKKTKPKHVPLRLPSQGNLILLFIAFGYLMLGLLMAMRLIQVDPPVIASFSVAGLLFAMSDLAKLALSGRWSDWFFAVVYFVSLLGSALCLVVVPLAYAYIGWLRSIIVPLGDVASFTGTGIIIAIIVFHHLLRNHRAGEAETRD
jgi:hypothetical protein